MTNRLRFWVVGGVVLVLAIAVILRLGYAGVNSFASDEARLSVLALETIREGKLATNGISSSTGARNLPASVYAFVIPYALSTDPLLATQWVGVWSVIAVVGVMILGWRVWGAWGGVLAGLVLACAPFAVFFSRNIWTQNFLAPIAVLWWGFVILAHIQTGKWRWLGIGGACFLGGIAFQIHAAGIVLVLLTAYAFVRERWWRELVVVIVAGLLAFLPLVPFLHQAWCCTPELITEYTQTLGQGERQLTGDALRFSAQIGVNYGWQYLALGDEDILAQNEPLAWGVALVLIIGTLGTLRQSTHLNSEQRRILEYGALLVIVPIIFFSYQSAPMRLHYLLMALPVFALVMTGVLFVVRARWWRIISGIVIMGMCAVWAGQALLSLSILNTRLVPNGIGMTLQVVRDTAQQLPTDHPIIVLTQSDDVSTRGEPATWTVLLYNTPHRILGGWTTLLLPATPALLFTDVNGMPAWEEVQVAGLAENAQTIQIFEQAPPSTYVEYNGQTLQGYTWLDQPIRFASGLELVAWRSREISGRLRISTVYRVVELAPATSIQQFTHLRTADTLEGAPPFTADISLGASHWQVGDTLIGIADFLTYDSTTEYWLDIGQYELNSLIRYPRLDEGDSVRLGGFRLR
jgi:4-amino-4-deoxy-L-arabinose transferase-like glycosyltransferase